MSQQRRQKIEFHADKKVSKPVKVEFYTKDGDKVSFKGHKEVTKPVLPSRQTTRYPCMAVPG